jgi:hypothetical protein
MENRAMTRIEFEADTLEELVEMARRWVAAYPELAPAAPALSGLEPPATERLADVLGRITSPASRQLLREVAACSLVGDALVVDDDLLRRCGVSGRDSFVGVLGVVNRTMRRRAHRDLLSWDPIARGYRMDPEDALVAAEVLGPPASLPPTAEPSP